MTTRRGCERTTLEFFKEVLTDLSATLEFTAKSRPIQICGSLERILSAQYSPRSPGWNPRPLLPADGWWKARLGRAMAWAPEQRAALAFAAVRRGP